MAPILSRAPDRQAAGRARQAGPGAQVASALAAPPPPVVARGRGTRGELRDREIPRFARDDRGAPSGERRTPRPRAAAAAPVLARAALAALALVAAAGCHRPAAAPPLAERWNLLLVTLDTVRADRLGAYGRAAAGTPHLDALAARGVRFDQAQASVPLTLPSHATVLTGMLPPRHGLRDNGQGALPDDVPSLAEHLRGAGWRTGAFVGAFVLDARYGLGRGFELYDDEIPRVPGRLDAERPGAVVVDRALAWLGAPDAAGRPFFAWVHLFDAHTPYAPPPALAARFPGDPYQAEISLVDGEVGRLFAALAARGAAGRTVIAVAGDHGESLGEHGEATHGFFVYQSTLRVPLLLAAPGVLPPRVVRTPVGLADLAPTLAALLGVPLAVGVDGRDLSPSLLAGAEPPAADLYSESRLPASFGWSPLAAIRRNGSKLVDAPREELYDLAADPGERRDLRAERRREAAELGTALAAMAATERRPAAVASDGESAALLRSLGYTAAAAPPDAGRGGRDAKDAIALYRSYETAQEEHVAGRLAEAEDALAELVAEDGGNPVFLAAYARVLRDRGRLGSAVGVFLQAAALAPHDPQVWYELATALQKAGRHAESRGALEHTLRQDPGRADAHNALGVSFAAEGRPADAGESFRRAVELDPHHGQAWNNLGNALRELDRLDEAAAAYERAAAEDPRDPEPLNGRGALEAARGRPREALAWLDRAVALAPDRPDVRLNRAIALDLAGESEEASAAYREVLELTAGKPRYAAERAAARQLLAQPGARARSP